MYRSSRSCIRVGRLESGAVGRSDGSQLGRGGRDDAGGVGVDRSEVGLVLIVGVLHDIDLSSYRPLLKIISDGPESWPGSATGRDVSDVKNVNTIREAFFRGDTDTVTTRQSGLDRRHGHDKVVIGIDKGEVLCLGIF